ncbi:MAG TPA: hypothetical protein PLS50_06365, partial [Candidatus Dojkabacteria bacterium]|nr:hypothetical protein [Candidatus Dojkabacteria bacterium]
MKKKSPPGPMSALGGLHFVGSYFFSKKLDKSSRIQFCALLAKKKERGAAVTATRHKQKISSLKSKVMEITARVTADAEVKQLKSGNKVVNFSVAV